MTGLVFTYLDSPVGPLMAAGDGEALHVVSFPSGSRRVVPGAGWQRAEAPFAEVRRQFDAYFQGELRTFDLPLLLTGTAFQVRVWRLLALIPYGETRTYGEIARDLGRPTASRAVGAANGRNPLPIILPCHRVVGANGSLTGFGGGLRTKEHLLRHEGAAARASLKQLSFL